MSRTSSTARRLIAGAGLVLLVASCARDTAESPRLETGTPVVLISIDTLRADRLPIYGYDGVETPAIDSLRADSILYERAYSHVPLTLPSHASILTGRLPSEHGIRDNLGVEIDSVDEAALLPHRLRKIGYRTAGFVSSYVLQRQTGLGDAFDRYDDTNDEISRSTQLQRRGGETLEGAARWLESVAGEPFFLFFHIYDPHTPYEAPEPYGSRYADPYDGEVAYSDSVVGGLLGQLETLGLYEDALVILLSDHGEGLGDHGEYEHGVFLYTSTQRVPLLIKLPDNRRAGGTVARPVGLIDVYPTVLELFGLEVPESLTGVSLLRDDVDPGRELYAEAFYARSHFGWSELVSLIGERYQYIDAPRPELYDLLEDPDQSDNLIREERRVAADLRRRLEAYDRTYEPPAEVDEETRERLAALGYVGSVAEVGDGPLADPKDRVETLRLLKDANREFQAENFEAVVAQLRDVLEVEPRMIDARDLLARALLRSGRPEEALAQYREAIALVPGTRDKMILASTRLLITLKRLDEAEEHALLLGDDIDAVLLLGEIAVLRGELDEAEARLRQARALDVAPLPEKKLRASIALARGNYEEAIQVTLEAEQLLEGYPNKQPLEGIYLTRGKAQVQLGRLEDAERSFHEEIELAPEQLQAYAHLALLYAVQDRGAETGRTLQRMVEENPTPLAYAEAVRTLRYIGDDRSAESVLRLGLERWPGSGQLRDLLG